MFAVNVASGPSLTVTAAMVGAGGAAGTAGGWYYGAPGGGGGYTYGQFSVSPGQTYAVVVGQGGIPNYYATTGYLVGGGGPASRNNSDNRYGGAGGGYTGIFSSNTVSQANAVLIAGGGGGGGSSRAGTGNCGGGGGGSTGGTGGSPYDYRGTSSPGTQSGAGTNASSQSTNTSSPAGALYGGSPTCNAYGGGGGGGYYGGGAGGYWEGNTMGGGSGGSAYIASSVSYGTTTTGSSDTNLNLYPTNGNVNFSTPLGQNWSSGSGSNQQTNGSYNGTHAAPRYAGYGGATNNQDGSPGANGMCYIYYQSPNILASGGAIKTGSGWVEHRFDQLGQYTFIVDSSSTATVNGSSGSVSLPAGTYNLVTTGSGNFTQWVVSSGSASIASPTSASTTVTITGNCSIYPVWNAPTPTPTPTPSPTPTITPTPTPTPCPAYGSLIGQECWGNDLINDYANGSCGTAYQTNTGQHWGQCCYCDPGQGSVNADTCWGREHYVEPVSYTHLTLPTKRIV